MPAITEPYQAPAGHPPVEIDAGSLTIEQIVEVARFRRRVALAPQAVERIRQGRDTVQRVVERREKVYGVTTGFGALCDKVVTGDQVKRLQRNLIISHASGVGAPFSQEVVRAMLLLRANTLASGNCGARLEVIETLIAMLNKGVHPLVPQKGSVGASGDLVPSAHLALTLIGEGHAHYQGQLLPAREAMEKAGIPLVELEAKEGLALINGTQAMTAVGAISIHDSEIIMKTADIVAALTIDALRGGEEPFDPRIHALRPHPGQLRSAANIRALLRERRNGGNTRVQDAYSLRCIPAVHGASRDALEHARGVVAIECNAVTDNPLVFPETQEFLSCGNFHGQPIALAMDFLSIGLCEIANISERRSLAAIRHGEYEALPEKLTRPEWKPDFGPARFNARAGATAIGARQECLEIEKKARAALDKVAEMVEARLG